jgi:hypothetical protein
VSSGGTVAPGVGGADTLYVNGSTFNLLSSAHLAIEINGTTAGTGGYDQVQMVNGGTVTLAGDLQGSLLSGYTAGSNNATLSGGQFDITTGDKFFLVIGAGNVIGTFANATGTNAGLTGYNTITIGGQEFAVSYSADYGTLDFTAGSGHDIALLAIPEPNTAISLLGGFGVLLGLQRFRRQTRARA